MISREQIIAWARWRKIPSFPDYDVSSCGLVKRGSKLLTQSLNVKGYPRVTMSVKGKSVSRVVHALVAEAFIGPRPDGFHVCHSDGNKTNNYVWNLRYATPTENEADKLLHGTRPFGNRNGMRTMPERRTRGQNHVNAYFTDDDILRIRSELENPKWGIGAALARKYNVTPQVISDIKCRRTWKHL